MSSVTWQQQQQQQAGGGGYPSNNSGGYNHNYNHSNGNNNNNINSPENNGPRAKCDQVIFEAIAKASEIIVHGRSAGHQNQQYQHGGGNNAFLYNQAGKHMNNNMNMSIMNSSSRFNLMVPEIQGVRQILQKWRRALHVPLRLDLYYQSPDNQQKELLERWCLEYTPQHQDLFLQQGECRISNDPIVQLRHVCKKIVVWLRTLMCSSRLLPAQAFQHPCCARSGARVGFSIYVLSSSYDGSNDDVTDLVEQQGFLCQAQPSSVLTPYGELTWKVYYASKRRMEPFLPTNHPRKAPLWMPREPSHARPIVQAQQHATSSPVAIPSNGNNDNNNNGSDQLSRSPNNNRHHPGVLQSAPVGAVGQYYMGQHQMSQQQQQAYQQQQQNVFDENPRYNHGLIPPQNQHNSNTGNHQEQQQQQAHTYHAPRHMMHRSNSEYSDGHQSPHPLDHHGHQLLRRNTSIGIGMDEAAAKVRSSLQQQQQQQQQQLDPEDLEKPERIMSGLSLALMGENNGNGGSPGQPATNGNDKDNTADHDENAEKRRAALHHAPPQLVDQPTTTKAGEYGYAYNNHISWQQIRPSSTVPITLPDHNSNSNSNNPNNYNNNQSSNNNNPSNEYYGSGSRPSSFRNNSYSPGRLGSSPSPLASTPPSGAFLRTMMANSSSASPSPSMLRNSPAATLIPPRNSSPAVAPPFAARPLGFAQEAPPPQSPLVEAKVAPSLQQHHHHQQHTNNNHKHTHAAAVAAAVEHEKARFEELAPPMTSLDLLHSSPFQQGASALSSMSRSAGVGHQSSLLRPSIFSNSTLMMTSTTSAILPSPSRGGDDDEDGPEYDMPFAVDDADSTTTSPALGPQQQQQQESPGQAGAGGLNAALAGYQNQNNVSALSGFAADSQFSLGSSAAVASFAQKCAPTQHRLKLFSMSTATVGSDAPLHYNNNSINGGDRGGGGQAQLDMFSTASDLTSQLAEFRSFGASLSLPVQESCNSGSDEGTNSSLTPVPTRT